MTEPVFKRCSCGREYTRAQWEALPDKKVYTLEWGEEHEQRNCPCGSTIVIVLKEGEKQDPLPGTVWYRKKGRGKVVVKRATFDAVVYRAGKMVGGLTLADFFAAFTSKKPCKCRLTLELFGMHAPSCEHYEPEKKS